MLIASISPISYVLMVLILGCVFTALILAINEFGPRR